MKHFNLKFPNENMEKEYISLQRTSSVENFQSTLYFLALLLVVPGVPALIAKDYIKVGITAGMALLLFCLHFCKAIPKNHLQFLVAVLICTFNSCLFFLPTDALDYLSKGTAYLRGYAFATLHVALLTRFTSLPQKVFLLVYSFAFRIGLIIYFQAPDVEAFPIIRNLYTDLFVIYINFFGEKKTRSVFKCFHEYREELMKFKELLSDYFPQSILVFKNYWSKPLFLNQAFMKTFGNIKKEQIDSEENTESKQISESSKLNIGALKVNTETIREVGTVPSEIKFSSDSRNLQDVVTRFIKENILDQKSLCFSAFHSSNSENKLFEVILTKVKWDGEDAVAILLNDITYQEKLISLKIADANKDQVIATVSHELRTPLNGIIGILGIVEKSVSDQKVIEYLGLCKDNANLLLGLVNSLLDLHQVRQGKLKLNPSRVNVNQVFSEVAKLFIFQANSKGLNIKLEVADEVPSCICTDENRLKQILINLIGNAMKFTLEGEILIEVSANQFEPQFLQVSVLDTGIGIREEDRERLFRIYEKIEHGRSVNKNGVGLGLTISNTLACLLSGKTGERVIDVESCLNKGSKFSFKILKNLNTEVQEEEKEEGNKFYQSQENSEASYVMSQDEFKVPKNHHVKFLENLDSPSKIEGYNFSKHNSFQLLGINPKEKQLIFQPFSSSNTKNIVSRSSVLSSNERLNPKDTILVVDDNPFNLLVAENIIKEIGYSFKAAKSGPEAIEIIKSAFENGRIFKAILMDCQMPIMDGFETTRTLRKMMEKREAPNIPIIALTANNGEEDIKECYASGMATHLSKPLFADILIKKLESLS